MKIELLMKRESRDRYRQEISFRNQDSILSSVFFLFLVFHRKHQDDTKNREAIKSVCCIMWLFCFCLVYFQVTDTNSFVIFGNFIAFPRRWVALVKRNLHFELLVLNGKGNWNRELWPHAECIYNYELNMY